MKTTRKYTKKSSKSIPEEYKSIEASVVPVTTVKLSARTRSQQRKDVRPKKIPLEDLQEGVSRLAMPKQKFEQSDNPNWKIPSSALKYKASKRIQSLAKPRNVNPKVSTTVSPQSSFQSTVSAKALNYIPTQRILELARPKRQESYIQFVETDLDDEIF